MSTRDKTFKFAAKQKDKLTVRETRRQTIRVRLFMFKTKFQIRKFARNGKFEMDITYEGISPNSWMASELEDYFASKGYKVHSSMFTSSWASQEKFNGCLHLNISWGDENSLFYK